jgi:hypothetical protein
MARRQRWARPDGNGEKKTATSRTGRGREGGDGLGKAAAQPGRAGSAVAIQGAAAGTQHELLQDYPLVFHGMLGLWPVILQENPSNILGFFPKIEEFVVAQVLDLIFQRELVTIGEKLTHETGLLELAPDSVVAL